MLCIIFKNKNPLCYFLLQKKRETYELLVFWGFPIEIRHSSEREKEHNITRRRSIRGRCEDDTKIREKRFFVSAPFSTFYSLEFTWIENSISYVCTWNRMQKSPSSLCIYRRLLLTSLRKEKPQNVSFSHFLNPPAITLDYFSVIMKHFVSDDDGR